MSDIIIHNAKVYLEQGHGAQGCFAEAVLMRDDKIAAVGANKKILSSAPNAEKIDARGNLLLPGFNDSHLHLHAFGRNLHRIQVQGVTSIDELVERGREFIERMQPPKGAVVHGSGWNQDLFDGEKRLPNRHDMDRISTEHAVIISRVCGYAMCCNTLALRIAEITAKSQVSAIKTADTTPIGDIKTSPISPYAASGQIELDDNGEPTGFVGEGEALYKLRALIPPYRPEQIEEQLLFAMRHALANGITSAGSMDVFGGNYQGIVDAYVKLFVKGDVHLRINLQCAIDKDEVFNEFIRRGWITGTTMGHPYLTMGASKLFADGSLGSRTAFMRKPYHDEPSTRGFQRHSQKEMDALVRKNHENGFQVIVHAIGDAAIDETLAAFEKVISRNNNDLRHGIVHCQITDMPLLQRMATNGILAFMQPIFLTHDLYILENRVGRELASTSYAHAAMKRLGIKAAYGTDSPVESMSPLECIACAVNRHDVGNGYPEDGFYPGECVDVYAAVDAYTIGSAYAEFAENKKGRIKPGFFADMTLLDRDIFTIPRKEIRTARVLWTMVGGKMAYMG